MYLPSNTFIKTSKQISEAELVERLRKRDKSALEYLYDNYSAALYGVVLRIVKSDLLAEEVIQDAFLKIWNRFNDYDSDKARLFTWMVSIARNLAIDKTRSAEFKQKQKSDSLEEVVSVYDKDNSYDSNVEYTGFREVLGSLPEEQKKLIDLMYFQGYSQSEISEEFNIPLGTVKTRVRSAMNTLRKLFTTTEKI